MLGTEGSPDGAFPTSTSLGACRTMALSFLYKNGLYPVSSVQLKGGSYGSPIDYLPWRFEAIVELATMFVYFSSL